MKEERYNYPVFSQSTIEELKDMVTYKDFIAKGIRFKIKKHGDGFSIFRPLEDIHLIPMNDYRNRIV